VSAGPEHVDVLEGGGEPPRWQRRWAAMPEGRRRLLAALGVLLVVGVAIVWTRERAADRDRAERVELAAALSVVSSSTSPPGGQVSFFVRVRNSGPLPVSLTEVEGYGERLLLWMQGDREVPLAPGEETDVPLSVRLTCIGNAGPTGLTADIHVRRQDGVSVTRRLALGSAHLAVDMAATVCSVRSHLRDHELSGPVLRGPPPNYTGR
jgi:hypothetical protein